MPAVLPSHARRRRPRSARPHRRRSPLALAGGHPALRLRHIRLLIPNNALANGPTSICVSFLHVYALPSRLPVFPVQGSLSPSSSSSILCPTSTSRHVPPPLCPYPRRTLLMLCARLFPFCIYCTPPTAPPPLALLYVCVYVDSSLCLLRSGRLLLTAGPESDSDTSRPRVHHLHRRGWLSSTPARDITYLISR